jgi:hypothetical protein
VTRALALAVLLAACGKSGAATVENVAGTAEVGGTATTIESCKAKKIDGEVFAVFSLATGHTVLMSSGLDKQVKVGKAGEEPKRVDCAQWSGVHGTGEVDGAPSVDGDIHLVCMHASGEIDLEVKYECGAKMPDTKEGY